MGSSTEATSDFLAYLDALMGETSRESFVEMRSRVGDTGMVAEFFPRAESERLARRVAERAAQTDVYIGCAPRSCRRGNKSSVREVWTLWVECDGAESAAAPQHMTPAPSLVIASGSGANVHAYWPLRAPVHPRDAQ